MSVAGCETGMNLLIGGHDGNPFRLSPLLRGLVSCVLRLPFSSQYRMSVAGCESGMNLLIADAIENFLTENYAMVKKNF